MEAMVEQTAVATWPAPYVHRCAADWLLSIVFYGVLGKVAVLTAEGEALGEGGWALRSTTGGFLGRCMVHQ